MVSCPWRGVGVACPFSPVLWLLFLPAPFGLPRCLHLRLIPIMRSLQTQRAPSPTNTTFSGISSYRTEPYKSHRDKSSSISSTSLQESYQIARTHYDELSKYLASHLAKGSISPSTTFHLISPSQSSLQNQQILAQQHDKNSRGSRASNSRNYLQTSLMN